MKRYYKQLIIIFALLFSYVFIIGLLFSQIVMYIRKKTPEEIIEREKSYGHFNEDEYDSLPKEKISIPSPFGYDLYGEIIRVNDSNKYMIFCHGVTQNIFNSIKYMNIFLKRGWNAVIYDHRRHGRSGGKTTSYGYYEKHDLKAVIDYVKENEGENSIIGIHGESMGAATLLLYAGGIEDGADFYIADCPFSNLEDQLTYRLKVEYKMLPKYAVMPIAKTFLRLRDKYDLKEVSPIAVIENIKSPILFIHSEPDDYIPKVMTEQLFEKKKGMKKLYLAPKGQHAMSYTENREEYERTIDEFLEEINLS